MDAVARRMETGVVIDDVEQWAVATTKQWSTEVRQEISREKHRARTTRYRARRQANHEAMAREHQRLEETLQRTLAAIEQRLDHGAKEQDLVTKIQHLALERELLNSQKADLRAAILPYYKFHQLIKKQGFQVSDQERHECKEKDRSRIRDSRWIPALPTPDRPKEGWRVHFPNGEPSFFFHPFTREEFDVHLKSCDAILALNPPSIEVTGSLLGWTVHHAPVTGTADDNSLVAHARFTRRVRCSLTDADKMLDTLDIDDWPLITTPLVWGYDQSKRTHCQVLQEFDTDAYVLVRNIPGPVHTRYVNLARRLLRKQENGRPMTTYATVIAASEANVRSQGAEESGSDVQWIREGGTYIKFAEVDKTMIDVTYEHWSSCHDEVHAQHLFIRWAQYAVRLQQWVLPTRLLTS
ncbi:hypothetical protein GQ600_9003 [Phytophthora cactorum]|nr:hypothetical protein GQ600_9003 [Phytophthora cactorum]